MIDNKPADSYVNLGCFYMEKESWDLAETSYRTALTINPQNLQAYIYLAQLFQHSKNFSEAEKNYRIALSYYPTAAEVHHSLGLLLNELQRTSEAEQHYRLALQYQPGLDAAHNSLGKLLCLIGREEEAEIHFRQVRSQSKLFPISARNLSELLLSQGRYAEGWKLNEQHYRPEPKLIISGVSCPRWHGESLSGKSLMIWPEQNQNLKDQIQFARYGSQIKQMGVVRLTLVCDDALSALLLTAPGFDNVVPLQQARQQIDLHDFWSYPSSLSLYCHEIAANIPGEPPYLSAWSDLYKHWNTRLQEETGAKCRIGLIWTGDEEYDNDVSCLPLNLSTLKPLWHVSGTCFISLQKHRKDKNTPMAHEAHDQPLLALDGSLRDFADIAAVITALDLVICVDTAVAHLAGALGKPVWVMLPRGGADWRWLHERNDTPWYPGVMRLFRQQISGNWNEVIEQVKKALSGFVQQYHNPSVKTLAPSHAHQYYSLAAIAENYGEFDKAAQMYLCALDKTPLDALLRHKLVLRSLYALKQSGEFPRAIALANTEMPHWQNSPDFFYIMGDLMLDWAILNPDIASNKILPLVEENWLKCLEVGELLDVQRTVYRHSVLFAANNLIIFYESLGMDDKARLLRERVESLSASSEVTGDEAVYVYTDDAQPLADKTLDNIKTHEIRTETGSTKADHKQPFLWENIPHEIDAALIHTRERLLKLTPKTNNNADIVELAFRCYQEDSQPESIDSLLKIIAVEPENAPALHQLGIIALQAERYADAEPLIRQAISIQPDFADAHHNLGVLLIANGNPAEALVCFETALRLNPDNAGTRQKLEEAKTATRRACTLLQRLQACRTNILQNPGDDNAVMLLTDLRREIAYRFYDASEIDQLEILFRDEAGDAHRRLSAMGIAAFAADTRQDSELLAQISADLTKGYGGSDSLRALLVAMLYFGPHQIPFWIEIEHIPNWLVDEYFTFLLRPPQIFHEIGQCEYYCQYVEFLVNFLHTRVISQPDIPLHRSIAQHFVQSANFTPLYFSARNLKRTYRQRAELIELYLTWQNHAIDYPFNKRDEKQQKIRLGVLAPNFAGRSETYATIPVFRDLDRSRYEIILLTLAHQERAVETYCARYADSMVILQEGSVWATVDAIRKLDLDVIWIGSNITATTNDVTLLSAHRLARLQLTGCCSPTTTGFHNIDAFISGTLTEPETGAQEHYCEPLFLVNGPALCFDFPNDDEYATLFFDRARLNISDRAIVYASGANYFKIIPELESLWLRILADVPESVLLLYPFNPNWTRHYPIAPFLQRLQHSCMQHGIDVGRIVIQAPMPSSKDIKELLKIADVYLDSFPHSGMTSLIDPLETGLPIVTLEGNLQRGKQASATLKDLELTDLIAPTEEAYRQIAVKLGRDPALRSQYKQRIRTQMAKIPKLLNPNWYGKEIEGIITGLTAK